MDSRVVTLALDTGWPWYTTCTLTDDACTIDRHWKHDPKTNVIDPPGEVHGVCAYIHKDRRDTETPVVALKVTIDGESRIYRVTNQKRVWEYISRCPNPIRGEPVMIDGYMFLAL